MKPIHFNTLTAVLVLGLATNLYAGDDKHDHDHKHEKAEATEERVQHGSHEHGAARLTMAKTDTGMEITLETPAANLFGFEHQANDKEEHKAVQAATEKLNAGDTLFIANKEAKCKLAKVDIDSDIASSHKKEDHKDDHDKHDDHSKEDKKDHDKHDDHGKEDKKDHDKHDHGKEDKKDHDKHEHDDHKKETHSDVDVTWAFNCEQPKALKAVETKLFSQFPKGFEQLNVEWLTNDGAGKVKLDADGIVKLEK